MFEYSEIILSELKSKQIFDFKIYFIIHDVIHDYIVKKYGLSFIEKCITHNIIIETIPLYVTEEFNNCNAVISSFKEEKYLRKIINEKSIKKLLLLQIDHLQLSIGLNSFYYKASFSINGILFSPFNVVPKNQLIYRLRKYLFLRILLFNKCMEKIYIFNDLDTVLGLKKIMNDNRFYLLQDPIKINNGYQNTNSLPFVFSPEYKYILSIGGVSFRKNIHNVLQSLKLIPIEFREKIKFVICGVVHDVHYEQYIHDLIDNHIIDNLIFIKKFMTSEEIDFMISKSDIVMAAYLNFFYSSGIVGNASKFNKPVICANEGMMANIIQSYGIGILVNPKSPIEIANAIYELLFDDSNNMNLNRKYSEYFNNNHYSKFASNLFDDFIY
jgi:glycosyltransferase involved in cell wall biosynthesis